MREWDTTAEFPRELLEHGSDVFFRTDIGLVFRYLSPNVERILGWSASEMLGRHLDDFVIHDDRDDAPAHWYDQRGTWSIRGQIRHKAGHSIWFENQMLGAFDDAGVLEGYIGIFRDIDHQVTAETQLQESERQYRLIAEHASEVVVRGSTDGTIEWVSPSMYDALGITPTDLVGSSIRSIIDPADLDVLNNAQDEMLHGRPTRFEARFVHADGRPIWQAVRVTPFRDEKGDIVGRVASWRNIDIEHEQRVALLESEERFRLLVEHASDVVVQLDNDGVVTWLSPSAAQILGHHLPDLIGRPARELVHPDDLAVVTAVQEGAAHGDASRFEARYRRGDGSYIWMSVVGTPLKDEHGTLLGRIASARNIDAERAARDALAASEEQFRFLVENAQDVVVRTEDGEIVFVSPSAERVLGWTMDDIVAQPPGAFIHPFDADAAAALRAEVAGRPVSNMRLRLLHRDGRYRWIEITARPVDRGDGHQNTVAVLRDVSDRVTAEEALAAATAEALAANVAKTTFLSRMSHELRTPLNAVLGFAQLLGMDPLSDDQRSAVDQIQTGGRYLLDLINEVLDIARIESGRMTLSPESVSAADVISECLDMVRPLAAQHGVILERFDGDACTDQLHVDRQRTIQILINLVTNAIKYNRVGGRVRLKCEHVPARPDVAAIAVSDDGIGISAPNLPKLFAPFERLGAASTGVEGTGIGLALSRGLADMMGGQLTVESTEGVGSTFRLILPRAEHSPDPIPLAIDDGAVTSARSHRSVVYVEDNPANVMLMRSVVARRGAVDLTVVTRGVEALDVLFSNPPDLLLLDLHLPDISGEEVLRRLRTDPRTASLPVVVLTADAAPQVRHHLATLGADAFLAKPVDIADVISWIDDPLRGRKSR